MVDDQAWQLEVLPQKTGGWRARQGAKFEVPQEKARPVDPNCLKGVEDLLPCRDMVFLLDHAMPSMSRLWHQPRLSLGDFNEGALLHNVRQRYFDDLIYTGIGSADLKVGCVRGADHQRRFRGS